MAKRAPRAASLACLLAIAVAFFGTATASTPEIFQSATVSQTPTGIVVSWHAPSAGRVRLFVSNTLAERGVPAGQGGADSSLSVTESLFPRTYVTLVPDHGRALTVADRSLHLSGSGNFRDIGGYRTQDGHWVRMGRAYRSGDISRLTPSDIRAVNALGLRLVCDLRTDDERTRHPDLVAAAVPDIQDSVLAGDAPRLAALTTALRTNDPKFDADAFAQSIYRDFVRLPSARAAYHALFEDLANPARLPMLFHCSAGKDRTGWAAAVLLTLLGVPYETVLQDYVLTQRFLQDTDSQRLQAELAANPGMSRILLRADPADLAAAFDEMHARYDNLGNYLTAGLDLTPETIARIHANFLQD